MSLSRFLSFRILNVKLKTSSKNEANAKWKKKKKTTKMQLVHCVSFDLNYEQSIIGDSMQKIIPSMHCHYGASLWFVSFYTSSYFCWNEFCISSEFFVRGLRFGRGIKWIVTQCPMYKFSGSRSYAG